MIRLTSIGIAILLGSLSGVSSFANNVNHQRAGVSTSKTASSTLLFGAPFRSDGGIMLEEKRAVPTPNPSTAAMMLMGTISSNEKEHQHSIAHFASDGGIMLEEAKERPLAYISPPVAAKVETKGQSFASYKSDGGIMMVQDVKKPSTEKPTYWTW